MLDAVSGSSNYFAGINVKVPIPLVPLAIDRLYVRLSVTSSVRIEATMVFATADQAEKFKGLIDMVKGTIPLMPSDKKKLLDPIISALNIRQNGSQLDCDATWQSSDILALVKAAKENPGGFSPAGAPHGPFGGPPGGPPARPGMFGR